MEAKGPLNGTSPKSLSLDPGGYRDEKLVI